MRILFVSSGLIPYPGVQGTMVVCWSVVKSFREMGHDVSVGVIRRNTKYDSESMLAPLTDAGVESHIINMPEIDCRDRCLEECGGRGACRGFAGSLKMPGFYPEVTCSEELKTLVERIRPDVLFLFTPRAVAATVGCQPPSGGWPLRFATSVDLDHLNRRKRIGFDLKHGSDRGRYLVALRQLLPTFVGSRYFIWLLSRCDQVVNHAAHHAAWLRRHGVPKTAYIPLPVSDTAGAFLRRSAQRADAGKKLRIIMVGSPRAIVTLDGFPFVLDEILPALDQGMGVKNYQLHMIGSLDGAPEKFKRQFRERPSVVLRGYVDDIAKEFTEADLLLVPTPLDLGFRTRIAEAFSHGCSVVAHSANRHGMPELRHNENVLFADTGKAVAVACRRLASSPELSFRLGVAARDTFQRHYDANVVCRRMIKLIEKKLEEGKSRKAVSIPTIELPACTS